MSTSANKLWLQKVQNTLSQLRAQGEIARLGRALPCRVVSVQGSLVTVAFEIDAAPLVLPQVTIPKAESQWIRSPTQIGEYGMTVPSDVYLGGISGLGGGTASMTRRAPLAALVYVPCAAKSYNAVNTNAAYIAGPQGAVLQTEDGKSSLVINESGITLTFNGQTITFNASGLTSSVAVQVNNTVTASQTIKSTGGDVLAGSISLTNHVHSGVQSGSSNTGPAQG